MGVGPGAIGIVSFFSGVGALDLGLEAAGFRTWMANEIHAPFAAGYRHGREAMGSPLPVRGIYGGGIEDFLADGWRRQALRAAMGEAREETGLAGFAGGPPCPDFSVAGRQAGSEGANGRLTQAYVDLICAERPDFFLFENVRGLLMTAKHRDFYFRFKKQLAEAGYATSGRLLNTMRYWVPQDRWRVMLVGFRKDVFGPRCDPSAMAESFPWEENAWDEDLDPFALPWPTTDEFVVDGALALPHDIPFELTPEWWFRRNAVMSHANAGHAFRPADATVRFLEVREGDTSRKSFKRLHRWRYSPTVAYGNNEVHLHPYKPRRLSVAEAMALQTMPPGFVLPAGMSLSDMFKTVGNAVPYMFAEAIGDTLHRVLRAPFPAAPSRGARPARRAVAAA